MRPDQVDAFLSGLSQFPQLNNCFNPWAHATVDDAPGNGPAERRDRLRLHLMRPARLVLVGEAPGYQGARISGLPFTSEALMLDGAIPGLKATGRLSTRARPWSEPSARILWGALYQAHLADRTVLWNAFPIHPHAGDALSNRTPTRQEIMAGKECLQALLSLYDAPQVVAVGRKAEESLQGLGIPSISVRHPAMGGAPLFRRQIAEMGQDLGAVTR